MYSSMLPSSFKLCPVCSSQCQCLRKYLPSPPVPLTGTASLILHWQDHEYLFPCLHTALRILMVIVLTAGTLETNDFPVLMKQQAAPPPFLVHELRFGVRVDQSEVTEFILEVGWAMVVRALLHQDYLKTPFSQTDEHLSPIRKVSLPSSPAVTCFTGAPTTLFTYCVQYTNRSLVPRATADVSGQALSTAVDLCRRMPVLQTLHPNNFFVTASCFVW